MKIFIILSLLLATCTKAKQDEKLLPVYPARLLAIIQAANPDFKGIALPEEDAETNELLLQKKEVPFDLYAPPTEADFVCYDGKLILYDFRGLMDYYENDPDASTTYKEFSEEEMGAFLYSPSSNIYQELTDDKTFTRDTNELGEVVFSIGEDVLNIYLKYYPTNAEYTPPPGLTTVPKPCGK